MQNVNFHPIGDRIALTIGDVAHTTISLDEAGILARALHRAWEVVRARMVPPTVEDSIGNALARGEDY